MHFIGELLAEFVVWILSTMLESKRSFFVSIVVLSLIVGVFALSYYYL